MEVHLGRSGEGDVRLSGEVLRRHVACLGSSGSGKTVACKVVCEEAVRAGIPVIAVDPQGDIASLALTDPDPDEVEVPDDRTVDPDVAREVRERAEVCIWTPGSSRGLPLGLSPLSLDGEEDLEGDEALRSLSLTAKALAGLAKYDLDRDDGRTAQAVLEIVLEESTGATRPRTISDLADHVSHLEGDAADRADTVASGKLRKELAQRLRLLTIGSDRLLFERGLPLDPDLLLGRPGSAVPAAEGRTRVSVITLNSLSGEDEKAFVLAELARALYRWMLRNPSEGVQAIFYVDEIAPFLPPVRKPACKEILRLLFKQARKYGVSCLIASQNPGDVDYRSLSQFGTWNLGRLPVRQDLKKVEDVVQSLVPDEAGEVLESLPGLNPGRFVLVSPEAHPEPVTYDVRWLATVHRTLREGELEDAMDPDLVERVRAAEVAARDPGASAPEDGPDEAALDAELEAPEDLDATAGPAELAPELPETEVPADPEADRLLDILLASETAFSKSDLARRLDITPKIVGRILRDKEISGEIEVFRAGRKNVYYHADFALRPDLDLLRPVPCATLEIREGEAREAGAALVRRPFLFGASEELASCDLRYVPLWRVGFEIDLEEGLLVSRSRTVRDSVYLDEEARRVLAFVPGEGFRFIEATEEDPTRIRDLDDLARMEERSPGAIPLDEEAVSELPDPERARSLVRRRFPIRVRDCELTFLPVWDLELRGRGETRVERIDGVTGERFVPRVEAEAEAE